MKIQRLSIYISGLLGLGVLALSSGCGRVDKELEPGVVVAPVIKPLKEFKQNDVIVRVDQRELTYREYCRRLCVQGKYIDWSEESVSPYKRQAFLKIAEKSILSEFVARAVILAEARRSKLEADKACLAEARRIHEKIQQNSGLDFEQYLKELGLTEKRYEMMLRDDALRMTLAKDLLPEINVTDEELQNEKKRYERYNEICAATNKLVTMRGKQIVKKIRDGADFLEMALEYSESEEEDDGVWGEFVRSEIEDLAVRNAAFTLPVGDISDPIDTDRGLFIIKVLKRDGIDGVGAKFAAEVQLGRILLRLGQEIPCPRDEELRNHLLENKRDKATRKIIADLRDACHIEYPNGTNFWDSADSPTVKTDNNQSCFQPQPK